MKNNLKDVLGQIEILISDFIEMDEKSYIDAQKALAKDIKGYIDRVFGVWKDEDNHLDEWESLIVRKSSYVEKGNSYIVDSLDKYFYPETRYRVDDDTISTSQIWC